MYARELFLMRTKVLIKSLRRMDTFVAQLFYFVSLWLIGSVVLHLLPLSQPSLRPPFLDVLLASASAVTVTGLAFVDLEVFSSTQMVVILLLMIAGGEVFVTMLELAAGGGSATVGSSSSSSSPSRQLEPPPVVSGGDEELSMTTTTSMAKKRVIRFMAFVLLGYLVVFHVGGSVAILIYLSAVSSARGVLRGKGIDPALFSVFVTASSFANNGYMPNKENMVPFKTNTGLLFIVISLILAGNTLFPVFLRAAMWALRGITAGKDASEMREMELAGIVMPRLQTAWLGLTVTGFVALAVTLYSAMDWGRPVLAGLSPYQKVVNTLFMSVNARHSGEGTLDLSATSPAVLVLFIVMMYLPGSTFYMYKGRGGHNDVKEVDQSGRRSSTGAVGEWTSRFAGNFVLPHAACLAVFVVAICVTEREKLLGDPLNFSVFNIAFEVCSAYGNVGLSTGYNCKLQLNPAAAEMQEMCMPNRPPLSLSAAWSVEGKLIILFIMFFGRLKKFSNSAKKSWELGFET